MNLRTLPPFRHVNWEPDAGELRRFARAMLAGFGLLGLLAAWRHGGAGPAALALWGAGLLLAAAAQVPAAARPAYLAVYLPASLMGYVVSHVLLTAVFYLLFFPLGLLLRLLGKDLLRLRPPGEGGNWSVHPQVREPSRYYRQY